MMYDKCPEYLFNYEQKTYKIFRFKQKMFSTKINILLINFGCFQSACSSIASDVFGTTTNKNCQLLRYRNFLIHWEYFFDITWCYDMLRYHWIERFCFLILFRISYRGIDTQKIVSFCLYFWPYIDLANRTLRCSLCSCMNKPCLQRAYYGF